jgi:hypothetical protein
MSEIVKGLQLLSPRYFWASGESGVPRVGRGSCDPTGNGSGSEAKTAVAWKRSSKPIMRCGSLKILVSCIEIILRGWFLIFLYEYHRMPEPSKFF